MSTLEASQATAAYALARTPQESDRLRAQSRAWEAATGRLLDQVGLAAGASCLDAGCGPGEAMRLMAQRVGPTGRVTGVDVDAPLAASALTTTALLAAGASTAGASSPRAPGAASAAAVSKTTSDGDERRISKTHGRGAHAARVARHRIGGGRVIKVTEDRDDRSRYEVTLRRGAHRYEVELSRRFHVLDVDRERPGDDDD